MKYKFIDLTFLKAFSGDDSDFLKEMIEIFLENAPKDFDKMKQANQQKDWSELSKVAHGFKNSAQFIGLKDLQAEFLAIELDAKSQKNVQKFSAKLDKVGQVLGKVYPELKQALREF